MLLGLEEPGAAALIGITLASARLHTLARLATRDATRANALVAGVEVREAEAGRHPLEHNNNVTRPLERRVGPRVFLISVLGESKTGTGCCPSARAAARSAVCRGV